MYNYTLLVSSSGHGLRITRATSWSKMVEKARASGPDQDKDHARHFPPDMAEPVKSELSPAPNSPGLKRKYSPEKEVAAGRGVERVAKVDGFPLPSCEE